MGMYTEIKVECDVRADGDALTALQIMFAGLDSREINIGDLVHRLGARLFHCDRWSCIGNMSSAYFTTSKRAESSLEPVSEGVWRIRSISNLKNYDDEITHFFNWLRPMVVGEPGQVIGHRWYEEEQDDAPPTLVTL